MNVHELGCVCRFRDDVPRGIAGMAVCDGRCQHDAEASAQVERHLNMRRYPKWDRLHATTRTVSRDPLTVAVKIEPEGPWAVYDAYCLQCSYRYISVAPVQAEEVDLWECPQCRDMTVSWHAHPDWESEHG